MAKTRNSRPRKSSSSSSHAFFTLVLIFSLLLLLLSIFIIGVLFAPSFSLRASSPSSATVRSINSIFRKKLFLRDDGKGDPNGDGGDGLERWSEVISWEPRAVIYHNFLSKAECEHLIKLAEPKLEKSTVIDPNTGKSVDSRSRTSYGTFLDRHQDAIISSIEKRIAELTFIPEENGESIYVLRYEIGQYYLPHEDYFDDEYHVKNGGNRIATILMYLSNVEEGGETIFPFANGNFSMPESIDMECPKNGIVVKPKIGDALLFWSMKPDATPDRTSVHGGCPVIKGTKWSATKWLRFHKFN